MDSKYWDEIYLTREPGELGWYEAVPATLDAVIAATSSRSAAIIDVGAGASTLADHLLDAGFGDVTLLDLSATALETTRLRLGATPAVTFLTDDVTSFAPTRQWDLWHDRAVFHFLVDPEHRAGYKATMRRALAPGAQVVMATFAPGGPEQCAGQPVAHFDEEALVAEFAGVLDCIECTTPLPGPPGSDQRPYVMCTFRRSIDAADSGPVEES